VAAHPNSKLKDHPLSTVRDCCLLHPQPLDVPYRDDVSTLNSFNSSQGLLRCDAVECRGRILTFRMTIFRVK
jgi:hypothetical protein